MAVTPLFSRVLLA